MLLDQTYLDNFVLDEMLLDESVLDEMLLSQQISKIKKNMSINLPWDQVSGNTKFELDQFSNLARIQINTIDIRWT